MRTRPWPASSRARRTRSKSRGFTPRHAPEVDRLEVREQRVVALDVHDRLVRRNLVALVQGADGERVPAVLPPPIGQAPARAQSEDRDRLVDAAEQCGLLLEDPHSHGRTVVLGLEHLLREREVGVGVVAVADALDRQVSTLGSRRSRTLVAPMARF